MASQLRAFQSWLREIVLQWRLQVGDEIAGGPAANGPIFSFYAPCQIDIFRVYHAFHHMDFRLCFVRHSPSEPDLSIRVVGTYLPSEATAGMAEYIASPQWNTLILPDGGQAGPWAHDAGKTYRDVLEEKALVAYYPVKVYLTNIVHSERLDGRDYGSMALTHDLYVWSIVGRIERLKPDPARYVSEQLSKRARPNTAMTSPATQRKQFRRGRGAFLLPPVWVGEIPTLTIKDRLDEVRPALRANRRLAGTFACKDRVVYVTQSGFFAVDTEDSDAASQLLNEVFACLLIMGRPASVVAPTDLIQVQDVESPLTSYGYDDDVTPEQISALQGETLYVLGLSNRQTVFMRLVEAAAQWVGTIGDDASCWSVLQMCLEAWTQLHRREYRSTLLSAWTAIEVYCYRVWNDYIQAQTAPATTQRRLRRLDISRVSDLLRLNRLLDADRYAELDAVRVARNGVIHTARTVTKEQASAATALALRLASAMVGMPEPELLITSLTSNADL